MVADLGHPRIIYSFFHCRQESKQMLRLSLRCGSEKEGLWIHIPIIHQLLKKRKGCEK